MGPQVPAPAHLSWRGGPHEPGAPSAQGGPRTGTPARSRRSGGSLQSSEGHLGQDAGAPADMTDEEYALWVQGRELAQEHTGAWRVQGGVQRRRHGAAATRKHAQC